MKGDLQICETCGKEFVVKYKGQRFCCRECVAESYRDSVECVCEYCGKKFKRKRSEVEKNKRHFCSVECKYNAIRWLESDVQIVKENYQKMSPVEVQELLIEKHSTKAIGRKARELGVQTYRVWTEEETEILVNTYSYLSLEEVQKLLPDRDADAIGTKWILLS